jgi:hypothetical protein
MPHSYFSCYCPWQVATCHLGAAPSVAQPEQATLPFVLIQGPPGTGKTHTVKGVLNVWHLVHYQRYYNSLVAALTADAKSGVNMASMQSALDRKCANHQLARCVLHLPGGVLCTSMIVGLHTFAGLSICMPQ